MKKLNKFFAVLVALAMMASLAVTMAFAAPEDEDAPAAKTTTAPISKVLNVPQGTAVPAGATATFTFTNANVNGAAALATDVSIATQTLDLTTGTKATDEEKNVDTYSYTIADVLAGKEWTRPGVYEWDVEEATFVADDANDDTVDHLIKDTNKYKLVVKVVYDDKGNLVVDEVIVKEGSDENGDRDADNYEEAEGLNFENSYYTTTGNPGTDDEGEPDPTNPGDEDDDSNGLSVEKIVDGTYGDKGTQFEITVNVALPQIAGADEAKAVIRRADGTIEAVEIKNGDNVVKLAHEDKLVFTQIAEGTKYTVVETDSRKGTAVEQYTATGEVEEAVAVTKAANSATITNKSNQDDTTPTGILINNLPYIALALVAVGGLVAYVVIRRREEDNA